jgi:hypothetical protein
MEGSLNPGFTAEGFMITLAVQAIGSLLAIGGALLVTRYSLQHSFAHERDLRLQEEERRHAERTRVEREHRFNLLAAARAEIDVNVDAVAWMEDSPRAAFLLRRDMLNQCFAVLPVLPRPLAKALVEASIDIDRYNATVVAQMESTDPRAWLLRASAEIKEYLVINLGTVAPDSDAVVSSEEGTRAMATKPELLAS